MFPAASGNLTVRGSASIFYYLDRNCTDRATTSIDINVTLTLNGKPYAGRQVRCGAARACSVAAIRQATDTVPAFAKPCLAPERCFRNQ